MTRVAAILGHPVGHSISPAMQNAAFKKLGMDVVYVPFEVAPADLGAALKAVRAFGMIGVNITIPHKVAVMRHLDKVDKAARLIGAVNTIVNRGGVLTGYNTDGEGYLKSLSDETGFSPKGKTALILGSGGAARSIAVTLAMKGVGRIVIANRTITKARALTALINKNFKGVAAMPCCSADADMLRNVDLVVNTTSLGMKGKFVKQSPLFLAGVNPKAVISDIVYNPEMTVFLKDAKRRGLKIHKGLGMLIYQGALGFGLWTGKAAPVAIMARAAKKALR